MSYAVSKDAEDGSSIARGRGPRLARAEECSTVLPTKFHLENGPLPALAAPSRAPVKVRVQRNGELKQPESQLGGEYHESRAESI